MKETLKTPETKVQCVVLENIHTPPKNELEIPGAGGGEGVQKAQKVK